jgi:hypothetical protein
MYLLNLLPRYNNIVVVIYVCHKLRQSGSILNPMLLCLMHYRDKGNNGLNLPKFKLQRGKRLKVIPLRLSWMVCTFMIYGGK